MQDIVDLVDKLKVAFLAAAGEDFPDQTEKFLNALLTCGDVIAAFTAKDA